MLLINPQQLHPSSSLRPHLSVQQVCDGSGWENQPNHVLDLGSYCESSSCRRIRAPNAHRGHRCWSCTPARCCPIKSNHGAVPLLKDVSSLLHLSEIGHSQSLPTTVKLRGLRTPLPGTIFKIKQPSICLSPGCPVHPSLHPCPDLGSKCQV